MGIAGPESSCSLLWLVLLLFTPQLRVGREGCGAMTSVMTTVTLQQAPQRALLVVCDTLCVDWAVS